MKIVRFKATGKVRYGVLEGTQIVEYAGTPFGTFKRGRKKYPFKQAVLLSPVVPSKIVAVALNYPDHAEEMGQPVAKQNDTCRKYQTPGKSHRSFSSRKRFDCS